jgi:hypothetical protein
MTSSSEQIRSYEKLLVALENAPWNGLYRFVIGLLIVPVMTRLFGGPGSFAALVIFLVGVLITLRLLSALFRKALPFSVTAKSIFAERRHLGKRYDSYQWRKLLWIGVGMIAYGVVSGRYAQAQLAVASFCLICGILGWVRWRNVITRINLKQAASKENYVRGMEAIR